MSDINVRVRIGTAIGPFKLSVLIGLGEFIMLVENRLAG